MPISGDNGHAGHDQSLSAVRTLRDSLKAEERRVSYWRRLVQGRLDLVRTGLGGRQPTLEALAKPGRIAIGPALTRSPAGLGLLERESRTALSAVEDLWDLPVPWEDAGSLADLEHRLVQIEGELSRYRRLLHERIDACTDELIADYQRQLANVTELDVRDPEDDEPPDIPA